MVSPFISPVSLTVCAALHARLGAGAIGQFLLVLDHGLMRQPALAVADLAGPSLLGRQHAAGRDEHDQACCDESLHHLTSLRARDINSNRQTLTSHCQRVYT